MDSSTFSVLHTRWAVCSTYRMRVLRQRSCLYYLSIEFLSSITNMTVAEPLPSLQKSSISLVSQLLTPHQRTIATSQFTTPHRPLAFVTYVNTITSITQLLSIPPTNLLSCRFFNSLQEITSNLHRNYIEFQKTKNSSTSNSIHLLVNA